MNSHLQRLFESVQPLLPANLSQASLRAMTSANLLHVHAPLRGNDLLLLVFPGLISLGVKAELVQVSAESRWKATLRDRLRVTPGVAALRLSALLPEPPDPPEAPPRNAYTHVFPEVIEPVVEDLITITAVEESLFYFHRDRGETETIREMDFSRCFTHLVRLQRTGERNAPLQENVRDVLSRTIAYAVAYPDRIIRGGEADSVSRIALSAFLKERGTRDRSRTGKLLRKAGAALESEDISGAIVLLTEVVLPELQLPTSVEDVLLQVEKRLTPVERREMQYLARAGLPIPRTLIARRLHSESKNPDIAQTLYQMRYDSCAWVRAAALPPNLCFPIAAKE